MKIVVLGTSGMLGSMVLRELAGDRTLEVIGTVRATLDAERAGVDDLARLLEAAAWAVNAIGIIKPYIRDDDAPAVERAVRVNGLFPHTLARAAERSGCRVLQIATDCVYSGTIGHYREDAPHDALDVYGKTKSLGEVNSPAVHHLRCSIIGPEPKAHVSLLDWFLGQPQGAGVRGFVNHNWNGVTTLHFARLCRGIIRDSLTLPRLLHVVPAGHVSKHEMLQCFARDYERPDITITPQEAAVVIDRTLATGHDEVNRRVWASAGFAEPPSVPAMIADLASVSRPSRTAAR
jgi:dTDP-4-dehydrorhamnose reductase